MINDNEDSAKENVAQNTLGELMSDTEKIAVETLIEGSIPSDTVARDGTIDSVFSAISHPGRRYVLTYLLRSEGYVTMSELVDYVMEETDHSKPSEEFRREVTINLTHTHLPTLADEGFIDYNMERQLIMPKEKIQLTAPYLKTALIQQDRLSEKLQA